MCCGHLGVKYFSSDQSGKGKKEIICHFSNLAEREGLVEDILRSYG
jgi:hypothetical protein